MLEKKQVGASGYMGETAKKQGLEATPGVAGVKVVIDEALPSGVWQLRNAFGQVMWDSRFRFGFTGCDAKKDAAEVAALPLSQEPR